MASASDLYSFDRNILAAYGLGVALVKEKPQQAREGSEWQWVQDLIHDVTSERTRGHLAQRYFQWEFAQRQFRKLEFRTVFGGEASSEILQQHRAIVETLIEIADQLKSDYGKFGCEELMQLGITPDSIAASIESLDLSLDYCHHSIPNAEVTAAARKVFRAAS